MRKNIFIMIALLSLAVFSVNCGDDFLTGGILDSDPNRADQVPLLSQLVALQPIGYGFYVGDLGVYISVWMQQMSGTGNQWPEYEAYQMSNTEFGMFTQLYQEGGLIDIRTIKARAAEDGNLTILGMTQLYEAMMFASGADAWGAIPYSEAALTEFEHPQYDTQKSVYDACLALLDQAISNLSGAESSGELFDGSYDFSFGGDRGQMIRAAHTLKARIHLNWAEVDASKYALALAEAQQGFNAGENWNVPFEDAADQRNIWWQFDNYRGQYSKAGKYFVDMLIADGDPRLELYLGEDADGGYSGNVHGEADENTSWLNLDTFGSEDWDLEISSYEENQFIIAECQYAAGDAAAALATLNAVLGTIETRWDFAASSIQRYSGLTGEPLLKAIMLEKYKAQFLNFNVWADWKRTGYPEIVSLVPRETPRRFMYPDDEENANDNFPGIRGIWDRNANDPGDRSF